MLTHGYFILAPLNQTMSRLTYIISALLLIGLVPALHAQKTDSRYDSISDNVLFRKEMTGAFIISSNGWGFQFRKGKNMSVFKKRMIEIDLYELKTPKEVRVINSNLSNSKSYIFGKLNNLYVLHAGIGFQKQVNRKPYWGGIELRFFYYGGGGLGLAKPVYLYILNNNITDPGSAYLTEKYDPSKHSKDRIVGRAPFTEGFKSLKVYPDIYVKTGFSFDFGSFNRSVKALEFGIIGDLFPLPVPMMAYNKDSQYFISIYISFNLGKRYN